LVGLKRSIEQKSNFSFAQFTISSIPIIPLKLTENLVKSTKDLTGSEWFGHFFSLMRAYSGESNRRSRNLPPGILSKHETFELPPQWLWPFRSKKSTSIIGLISIILSRTYLELLRESYVELKPKLYSNSSRISRDVTALRHTSD